MAEPEHVRELLAQLGAAREEFRREVERHAPAKAKLEARVKQVERWEADARSEKLRIRKMYQRFIGHMKRKWVAERQEVERGRAECVRERADLERTASESHAYQQRLHASWEQLNESQRRMLADRQQAEQWIANQTDALDHRAETLTQQERQFAAGRDELESKCQSLRGEIAGLDARAANARAMIEQLELRQSRLLMPADGFGEPMSVSLVPVDAGAAAAGSDADGLLVDLHSRQQDLDRVRRKIFAARDELARQTTSLDDQRAVLSEQVATLVAARELWNAAELSTLSEMETLARCLRDKERSADLREQQLIEAERLSREREAELWAVRLRLEAWRDELAANEATASADFERSRKELAWREETLDETAQAWADLRSRERDYFRTAVESLDTERSACAAVVAEAERDRKHYAGQTIELAALELALEAAAADRGAASQRRIRVLSAKWERHFRRWEKRVEAGRVNWEKSADASEAARKKLAATVNDTLDAQREIAPPATCTSAAASQPILGPKRAAAELATLSG